MRTPRPTRRRLKKWRTRAERIVLRAGTRGFGWFMCEIIRTQPIYNAARSAGFDLLARLRDCSDTPPDPDAIMAFIMGRRHLPTRKNLEI